MPKVSVIIPAYNAMAYLPGTLFSLLQQTFGDFEAIVVNDGSTDITEDWVNNIKDSRVKLVSQSNQGASAARNRGIAEAQGEYIAFLDADDLWLPTKLAQQVRILDENPEVGLVYTWVAYIDENSQPTGRVRKNYAEGNIWQDLVQKNLIECGSVPMLRRTCLDTCGVFDLNLGSFVEDWDLWLRIAAKYPFKVIQEPLVYYRQVPTGGSRNWQGLSKNFRLVIEKAFEDAPSELLYLRGRSYGLANLCLAWKPLQSTHKEPPLASYFLQQAVSHYPPLRFSKEYLRLLIAITLMQWFGVDGYQKFLSLMYGLRRQTVSLDRL